jgi:ubiquinone/menaquinone biosynthesis C-methylase UbiE
MSNWDYYWSFNDISSWGSRYHHRLISNVFFDFLEKAKVKNPSIAEIGCGSGELTARLLEKFGGDAVLIDNCENALKVAKANFKRHGLKNVKFVKGNLFDLKLKAKFDVVHSEGLIEHFAGEEQRKAIEAHKRLLKKGGWLLICVPRPALIYRVWKYVKEKRNDWPFGYEKAMSKEDLRSALQEAGLKVVKVLEKGRYSFALAKI